MKILINKTGERIIPEKIESTEEYLIYLKQLFVYEFVKNLLPKDGYILELGCGEGYGTSLLSKYVKRIVGLDVDKKTISNALNKYGSKNCSFQLYNGLKIPYEDNTFDGVVSFQVIEHIKDDINFVSEAYRVLKKEGIFILTTPNRICRLKPDQRPWNRFHIREYYSYELENLLKSKFSDVRILGVKGDEEINRIEIQRLNQNAKLGLLVPLNLRKLIPASVESGIIRFIRIIIKKRNKIEVDFRMRYNLSDFSVTDIDIGHSLDLLGISKK